MSATKGLSEIGCAPSPCPLPRSRGEGTRKSPAARPWLTLVAIAFCAEGAFLAFFVSPVSHGIDFYHVNFVPAAVQSGFDIYDLDQHPAILAEIARSNQGDDSPRLRLCVSVNRKLYPTGFCPTATPLLYTVHALGLVGSFDIRFWIFHVAATILGVVGLFMTARASSLSRQVSWLLCGLVTSFCWALFLDAQLANVSRFQLFGLGVALAGSVSRRSWGMVLAGFALALGSAYKPTILPSIVFWMVVLVADRRWSNVGKGIAGLGIGTILSLLLPLVLFPSLDCWWEWKRFASAELNALSNSFPGNYSLQAAMTAIGLSWAALLPWVIGGLLLVILGWTACPNSAHNNQRAWRDHRLCLAIAAGPLWTILASPLTWVQYSALTMPLVVVLIGVANSVPQARGRWICAITVAGGFSGGLLQRFVAIDAHWIDCGLLWIGWVGLLILAVGMIASSRPPKIRPLERDCKATGPRFGNRLLRQQSGV